MAVCAVRQRCSGRFDNEVLVKTRVSKNANPAGAVNSGGHSGARSGRAQPLGWMSPGPPPGWCPQASAGRTDRLDGDHQPSTGVRSRPAVLERLRRMRLAGRDRPAAERAGHQVAYGISGNEKEAPKELRPLLSPGMSVIVRRCALLASSLFHSLMNRIRLLLNTAHQALLHSLLPVQSEAGRIQRATRYRRHLCHLGELSTRLPTDAMAFARSRRVQGMTERCRVCFWNS